MVERWFATLVLASVWLFPAVADAEEAAPAPGNDAYQALKEEGSAPADVPEIAAGEVSVEQLDGAWVVVRKRPASELASTLRYSFNSLPPTEVAGTLSGDNWRYFISEKIPEDAAVHLEFRVFSKLEKSEIGTRDLNNFVLEVSAAAESTFQEAAQATSGAADREQALHAAFSQRLRVRISELLSRASLTKYVVNDPELGRKPVTSIVLERMGFRHVGGDIWEPTLTTVEKLNVVWDGVAGQRAAAAEVLKTPPTPRHECAGSDAKLLEPESDALREKAIRACLSVFVQNAEVIQKVSPPAAPLDAIKQAELAKFLEPLKKPPEPPAPILNADQPEFLAAPLGPNLRGARSLIAAVKSAPKVADAAKAALSAVNTLAFLAAHSADAPLTKAWRAAVAGAFGPNWAEVQVAAAFTQERRAHELFKHTPGKPRFFVSTGVIATNLGKDWKLALPVLVSICLAPTGCETLGRYPGNGASYLSLDVGVKAIFLGQKDAREETPSFLLGFGITPIYALHLGLGINAFENRQTERANFAPYLSVTLDVLSGADILGELGLGKPKVEKVSP